MKDRFAIYKECTIVKATHKVKVVP